MAVIDRNNIVMARPRLIGTQQLDTHSVGTVKLKAAEMRAEADVPLLDIPGSFTGRWKFGFIQLEYAETNYARYRGRLDSHGSALSTSSRRFLVRDTDETAPDVWYDPPSGGVGATGRGTRVLRTATPIPASGRLVTRVMMDDRPAQPFATRITNGRTGFFNFIHHMESTFMFCTILTAQEPGGRFHFLKHFYWNVDFEAFFHVDAGGHARPTRIVRNAVNIQSAVHSGSPRDRRFHGRELDLSLRIANDFVTHDHFGRTWEDVAA